jgi:hypothetical protein
LTKRLAHHLLLLSLLGLLALLALAPRLPAHGAPLAQDDDPPPTELPGLTLQARAGFDGLCKDMRWIPLRIILENIGPALTGELIVSIPDSSRRPTLYTFPLELASTSRKEIRLAVYPEAYVNNLDIRLRVGGVITLAQKASVRCLPQEQIVMGVLAGNPSALNSLADYPSSGQQATLARLEPGDLPEQAQYLESLDVLLISDLDSGTLQPAQLAALRGWVLSGGQLLVTGGAGWQKSVAGLQDWLPFLPDGLSEVDDLSALADFSGVAEPPGQDALAATGSLSTTAHPAVLLSAGDQILAASRNLGFGRVLYLAFDPASEPLRSWPGAPGLLRALLEPLPSVPVWAKGFNDWYQAGSAITSLPSLRLVGVGWLLAFLFSYTLTVGPLNYFVLRRFKQRELAWLTIPLLVVIFAGGAFMVGGRSRGSLPVISRLAIIQVWPGQEQARLDGLVGVFSPTRQTYTLALPPGLSLHPLRDSNLSAPPDGFEIAASIDGAQTAPDLRLDVAGMRALSVSGTVPAPQITQDLQYQLSETSARLSGQITNHSSLHLENVVLLGPGSAQLLGNLDPGASLELGYDLQTNPLPPSVYRPVTPGPGIVYYSGPGSDQAMQVLVGGNDYYNDARLFRRFSLLSAAAGYNFNAAQAGGYYLAAWSSDAPFDASLDRRSASDDEAFYLIALQPELIGQDNLLSLPPALFRWSVPFNEIYYSPDQSPYGGMLSAQPLFFYYQLIQPIPFESVQGLTLHLKGVQYDNPQNSQGEIDVALWDFERQSWAALQPLPFGDHPIARPQRFVGLGGEIRLRLANPNEAWYTELQQADFTLQVRRSAP